MGMRKKNSGDRVGIRTQPAGTVWESAAKTVGMEWGWGQEQRGLLGMGASSLPHATL